jgi:hypothetical protein
MGAEQIVKLRVRRWRLGCAVMRLVHYRGPVPNFGDDLNPMLWPALADGLIDDDPDDAFVGIGTIIGMPCAPPSRLHVFSSGVGNDPLDSWAGRDVIYWCVRGPISAALLGLPPAAALTDGAILTPFATGFPKVAGQGATEQGAATLVIPHFQTLAYPGWDQVAAQSGFELLDPRGDPRDVVARIACARLVLTESLHGAILADTYGIPWRVFATSGNFCSTKFVDWCQSVGLPFSVTYLPPPNAAQLLEQGRGHGAWGRTEELTQQDALAAFAGRVAPRSRLGMRGRLKSQLRGSRMLQALLRYSPQRTAAALVRLAKGRLQLSDTMVRADLQDRMLTRLAEVGAHQRARR